MEPENYKEGLWLFSCYAFVCARTEWGSDYEWLKKIVEKECEPNGWLLEYRFKNACKSYHECQYCEKSGYTADFSRESVAYHWRNHHGHEGDCAIRMLVVIAIDEQVISVGLAKPVVNFFKIPLQVGDRIFVHRGVVIEKAE